MSAVSPTRSRISLNGAIDLVIDWKTDVSPSTQQIDLYREQMRDYLVATGAPEGLLVFVTTGQLVRVRSKFQEFSASPDTVVGGIYGHP